MRSEKGTLSYVRIHYSVPIRRWKQAQDVSVVCWLLSVAARTLSAQHDPRPAGGKLADLKRDRVNQRLIGTFNYALRSFGAQCTYHPGRANITAMAGRVVQGSFSSERWVKLMWTSRTERTQDPSRGSTHSELRLFVLYYRDGRRVLKSDNRPQSMLEADHRSIKWPRQVRISSPRSGRDQEQ